MPPPRSSRSRSKSNSRNSRGRSKDRKTHTPGASGTQNTEGNLNDSGPATSSGSQPPKRQRKSDDKQNQGPGPGTQPDPNLSLNVTNPTTTKSSAAMPPPSLVPNKPSLTSKSIIKPVNFAAAVGAKAPEPTEQDCKPSSISAAYSRTFRLRGPPPAGMVHYLDLKWNHCVQNQIIKYKIEGKTVWCLRVSFDGSSEDGRNEWTDAKTITYQFNKTVIRLTSLESNEIDSKGTIKPRLMKSVVMIGIDYGLTLAPEIVKDQLKEFMEFEEKADIKIVKRDGKFRGKAWLPVKRFIKVPPREFEMPIVQYDTEQHSAWLRQKSMVVRT